MALTNGLLGIARPVVACRVMAGLRFGIVSESVRAGRAWLDFARQVEDSGIDVLLLRDHFSAGPFGQQLAPFSGLAAAAAVTTRLRHRGGLVPAGVRRGRDRVRFGRPAARAAGRVARHHQAAAGRDPGPPCGRVLPDRRARPRRPSPPPAGRAGDRFGDLEISALGTFIVTESGGRPRKTSSPGGAGAGLRRRRCGGCRRSSSAARIRSAWISWRGGSGSACRTSWWARTASPRWRRSSAVFSPAFPLPSAKHGGTFHAASTRAISASIRVCRWSAPSGERCCCDARPLIAGL
jgi:hypothetical protein